MQLAAEFAQAGAAFFQLAHHMMVLPLEQTLYLDQIRQHIIDTLVGSQVMSELGQFIVQLQVLPLTGQTEVTNKLQQCLQLGISVLIHFIQRGFGGMQFLLEYT